MASNDGTVGPGVLGPGGVRSEPTVPASDSRGRGRRARHRMADPGGYITGLDGLRALAVGSVIVYHFVPGAMVGGFLGVDVFFVLSGFLITTLLLRETRKSGRVDLKRFWTRRARRLLPALVTLVLVVVPLAALVNRDLMVGIGRQVLGALTFSSNWLEIAHGSSYFNNTSPLLFKNFWSLAVEEQFYLLWPLLFIGILVLTRNWFQRWILATGIAVLSALWMAFLFDPAHPTRVYFGTDTHLFGLALGVALAFMWADRSAGFLAHPVWQRFSQLWGLLGLGGLLALMVYLNDTTALAYRGGIFAASICTAILIASMLAPNSPVARAGEFAPLRYIGTRSYGIYLWHWPIYVMIQTAFPAAAGTGGAWTQSIAALIVTLLVCEASYRFVEEPVRERGFRECLGIAMNSVRVKSRVGLAAAAVVGLLGVGTTVAVALAPDKSSVQEAIERKEAELAGGGPGNDPADPGAPLASPGVGGVDAALVTGGEVTTEPTEAEPTETEPADADPSDAETTDAEPTEAEPTETEPSGEEAVAISGDQMTAIGDSLIVTSADGLTYRFPGINYLAESNRQWHQAPAIVDAGLADGTIRDIVILDFGTNGGIPDESVVRDVIDKLGPDRTVVLVTIYGLSTFIDASNEILHNVAADYPNVIIADWHAAISAEPHKLQADQTHPDLEGMHLMAEVIDQALQDHLAS